MVANDLIRQARSDIGVFARDLVGAPLWEHQETVLRSTARHRMICSGRQAGKSTTLAIGALHQAFSKAGSFVLVISAVEAAAKDVLATITEFATHSPILKGSVVDDNKMQLVLSNNSVIRSIPSSQRQARGHSADLLVLDEACFIDESVWDASKFTIVARPQSKIIMSSTPWGPRDRFFAAAYRAGQNGADGYESFHWPSTVSPLVDPILLEQWRATDPERTYRAEVLAEWVDDAGAYFTHDEIMQAVGDEADQYELIEPGMRAYGIEAVAGIDWGFAHDASTIVLLAKIDERDKVKPLVDVADDCYWVPWLEELFGVPYAKVIDRIATVADSYELRRVCSEMNGVGAMPTQQTAARLGEDRVLGVHTTAGIKEDAFGRIKVMLQLGQLRLPNHPGLLRQLNALEYEQLPGSGMTRIAVPERAGHDDLAVGLALALHGDPDLGAQRRRRREKMRYREATVDPWAGVTRDRWGNMR